MQDFCVKAGGKYRHDSETDTVLTCVGTKRVQTETSVCSAHSLIGNTELR